MKIYRVKGLTPSPQGEGWVRRYRLVTGFIILVENTCLLLLVYRLPVTCKQLHLQFAGEGKGEVI